MSLPARAKIDSDEITYFLMKPQIFRGLGLAFMGLVFAAKFIIAWFDLIIVYFYMP